MKDQVILTRPLPAAALTALNREFTLLPAWESGLEPAEMLRAHPACRGLISFLSDPVGPELMAAGPELQVIANYAVGYNNIDLAAAQARGIYVCHTPDILTAASADLTLALLLAVARRLVPADAFTRAGRFQGWEAELFLGRELQDALLGIVGLGRIGTAVARRAAAFGMQVAYFSRTRKPELEEKEGWRFMEFERLLAVADVVSLHLPYSRENHHLLDRRAFDLMKKDAIFLNVARGGLMDEAALADKLEKRELFGAGLDVYEHEPKINERLLGLDNLVMVPHIGSATDKTRLAMARMNLESVKAALAGKKPPHLVPDFGDGT